MFDGLGLLASDRSPAVATVDENPGYHLYWLVRKHCCIDFAAPDLPAIVWEDQPGRVVDSRKLIKGDCTLAVAPGRDVQCTSDDEEVGASGNEEESTKIK